MACVITVHLSISYFQVSYNQSRVFITSSSSSSCSYCLLCSFDCLNLCTLSSLRAAVSLLIGSSETCSWKAGKYYWNKSFCVIISHMKASLYTVCSQLDVHCIMKEQYFAVVMRKLVRRAQRVTLSIYSSLQHVPGFVFGLFFFFLFPILMQY